jgi:hypothetical protein
VANFTSAKISNVNFEGANLQYAIFDKAHIRDSNFEKAEVDEDFLERLKHSNIIGDPIYDIYLVEKRPVLSYPGHYTFHLKKKE